MKKSSEQGSYFEIRHSPLQDLGDRPPHTRVGLQAFRHPVKMIGPFATAICPVSKYDPYYARAHCAHGFP
jgi:hypothetical protein